ncbi:MAG: hypothetical protein K2P86_13160 [Xanthobacteraceae bacterium]|nr:hypothetical protein [Xanthobacteraceae bacterium]
MARWAYVHLRWAMKVPEPDAMYSLFRSAMFSLLVAAALLPLGPMRSAVLAQERPSQERVVREIEARGFSNVTGLRRRGDNYVFQAQDIFGEKVRVVMHAETGEIVGLSRIMPQKK